MKNPGFLERAATSIDMTIKLRDRVTLNKEQHLLVSYLDREKRLALLMDPVTYKGPRIDSDGWVSYDNLQMGWVKKNG